jgi:tRNA nucleotidyltransferase/poly(A) polymerase
VRDELLGLIPKDIDYLCVPNDLFDDQFDKLVQYITSTGSLIYYTNKQCLTIRAKIDSIVADYVLPRCDVYYNSGSRIPFVRNGSLEEDLQRRDFTINCIAKEVSTGKLIDLFDGSNHIKNRLLVTPKDPLVTFTDDPLRVIRGIRFIVTLGFRFSTEVEKYVEDDKVLISLKTKVSVDRIRKELDKMFKANTIHTLQVLISYPKLCKIIFDEMGLWLSPTLKKK